MRVQVQIYSLVSLQVLATLHAWRKYDAGGVDTTALCVLLQAGANSRVVGCNQPQQRLGPRTEDAHPRVEHADTDFVHVVEVSQDNDAWIRWQAKLQPAGSPTILHQTAPTMASTQQGTTITPASKQAAAIFIATQRMTELVVVGLIRVWEVPVHHLVYHGQHTWHTVHMAINAHR